MDNTQIMEEILHTLKAIENSNTDMIAFGSLCIAILALIVTIVTNYKTHKQYINSLAPALSFDFFEKEGFLFLTITNTGMTKAEDIILRFSSIKGNGKHSDVLKENVFKSSFMLYPNEILEGTIAISGKNKAVVINPVLGVEVSYRKGNDNKMEVYKRLVSYRENPNPHNVIHDDLQSINSNLRSIKYSENRLANYIEGRTLFVFDEINTFPRSSLYQDLRDALNDKDRSDLDVVEKSEDINIEG